MKFTLSLFSLAALAASSTIPSRRKIPSSCADDAHVVVQSHNVTVAGHDIKVSTKACSSNAVASRSFEQRQIDTCEQGGSLTCIFGVPGPIIADCVELQAALPEFIATQPDLFEVAPQTFEEVSFGTCAYLWINDNPVGGAILESCWSTVETFGEALTSSCIRSGSAAGFLFPTVPMVNEAWILEVTLVD